ncbi:hypothetical protein [Dechloromonas sp.]|uniref:hypothetical protein n=1 Tax=Dechloromonas sp. TaxID=1917218 RepID=UPI00216F777F|nr:hypothetical protein [Dechloromonas sp.]MBU3695127.1 hypothetical protein [Dechloromonas sp.]
MALEQGARGCKEHSQTAVEGMRLLGHGQQEVADGCAENLDAYGVLTATEKAFDFEVLFDPFKEQLDFPVIIVMLVDLRSVVDSRQVKMCFREDGISKKLVVGRSAYPCPFFKNPYENHLRQP